MKSYKKKNVFAHNVEVLFQIQISCLTTILMRQSGNNNMGLKFKFQCLTFKVQPLNYTYLNFTHSIYSIISLFGFNFKSVNLVHYV